MVLYIKSTTDIPYKEFELGEARFRFPIGLHLGDRLYRNFTMREITGNDEIDIGRIEVDHFDETKPSSLYSYTRKLLQKKIINIIEEVDDINLVDLLHRHQLTPDQLVDRMSLADVIALFLNLRFNTYGEKLAIQGICPCPKRKKIIPNAEDSHNILTIVMRFYEGREPPVYRLELQEPVLGHSYIELHPPLFSQLDYLIHEDMEGEPVFCRLLQTCCDLENIDEIYMAMSLDDRQNIQEILPKVNIFGPEKAIAMNCPFCPHKWDSLLLNCYNYERFYLGLLSIPRSREMYPGENPAQIRLDEIAFFLSTGEQAPFSDAQGVYGLTVNSRSYWVKQLSETYEKQREEMKKSQSKKK